MEVMEAIRTRRSIRYPAAEGVFRGRKSAAEVISFDRY